MKVLTIQDISCYGQCSTTVALPILSSYGIETAILPSAILSTHTSGFNNFEVLDLTSFMDNIINHWENEKIRFNAIYTGYIGDEAQFKKIIKCKKSLLNKNGLFIVDPAMADHGKLYPALNKRIIEGMKSIVAISDYSIPNITEACFLTNNEYKEIYDENYLKKLLIDLHNLGSKIVILTGVSLKENELGVMAYDGKDFISYFSNKINKSFHGTGDIFSSIIVANIVNGVSLKDTLKDGVDFIIDSILNTIDDKEHFYGVKYEEILLKRHKKK